VLHPSVHALNDETPVHVRALAGERRLRRRNVARSRRRAEGFLGPTIRAEDPNGLPAADGMRPVHGKKTEQHCTPERTLAIQSAIDV
jgi:hypothetical protein